jgi:cellulose synthase/poly-beta-1,6-N-acetylglucosamine synthase-like glycosyltransferase
MTILTTKRRSFCRAKKYCNVRYVFECNVGIPYARNAGIRHARGSIIAFIDDDVIADKNWLGELIKGFKSDEIIGVGGPTHSINENIPKKKLVHPVLGTFDRGAKEQYVSFFGSGNCAFKREAFKLAFFDVNMKRFSDVAFCLNLCQLGYKLLYVPSAIVYTGIPPDRFGIKPVIQRGLSGGESFLYLNLQTKPWLKCLASLAVNFTSCLFLFFRRRDYKSFYRLLKNMSSIIAIPHMIRLYRSTSREAF